MVNTNQVQHKKSYQQKNGDKDGKALQNVMKNNVSGKAMENLRNRIDACKQQKRLFKTDIKTKLHTTKNVWKWLIYNT